MKVEYVAFSNLIIDDIVFPDGRTSWDTLGGGGLHALVGMRVWNASLGYAASVGPDLADKHREALNAFGVDVRGLAVRPGTKTARAWQLFEWDDYRTEIFRTDMSEFREQKIQLADLPADYLAAKGYHIQWGKVPELLELVGALRAANPDIKLVLEVSPTNFGEPEALWRELLPQIDLISPDEEESLGITGRSDPHEICATYIDWGVPLVALRMGARGSLVYAADGQRWELPAVPTEIVDVTGAGNSYCGGFTVALGEGLSPFEASLRAAVSASFALEQLGLPHWDDASLAAEAARRVTWARAHTTRLS